MSRQTKTALALVALAGGLYATAVLAEMGPGGMGGHEGMGGPGGPGGMLLQEFDTIDADKDGKITAAELLAHRLARFAAADTNSDGLLSADELSTFQMAQVAERMAERTTRMMQWMDADGDGSLSATEMPGGEGAEHLARLDTDGDGAISKAEAEAAGEGRMKKHRKGMMHD